MNSLFIGYIFKIHNFKCKVIREIRPISLDHVIPLCQRQLLLIASWLPFFCNSLIEDIECVSETTCYMQQSGNSKAISISKCIVKTTTWSNGSFYICVSCLYV